VGLARSCLRLLAPPVMSPPTRLGLCLSNAVGVRMLERAQGFENPARTSRSAFRSGPPHRYGNHSVRDSKPRLCAFRRALVSHQIDLAGPARRRAFQQFLPARRRALRWLFRRMCLPSVRCRPARTPLPSKGSDRLAPNRPYRHPDRNGSALVCAGSSPSGGCRRSEQLAWC